MEASIGDDFVVMGQYDFDRNSHGLVKAEVLDADNEILYLDGKMYPQNITGVLRVLGEDVIDVQGFMSQTKSSTSLSGCVNIGESDSSDYSYTYSFSDLVPSPAPTKHSMAPTTEDSGRRRRRSLLNTRQPSPLPTWFESWGKYSYSYSFSTSYDSSIVWHLGDSEGDDYTAKSCDYVCSTELPSDKASISNAYCDESSLSSLENATDATWLAKFEAANFTGCTSTCGRGSGVASKKANPMVMINAYAT